MSKFKDTIGGITQKTDDFLRPINEKAQELTMSYKVCIIAAVSVLMLVVFKPAVFRDSGVYHYLYNQCYDARYAGFYNAMGVDEGSLKKYCRNVSNCIACRISMEDLTMAKYGYSEPRVARTFIKCGQKHQRGNKAVKQLSVWSELGNKMQELERWNAILRPAS